MRKTFKITVFGKVQGVYFRQSTYEKALLYNLIGNVKNLPNGAVEINVTGEPTNINKMLDWCRIGPAKAEVKEVLYEEVEFINFVDFVIEH